MSVDCLPVQSIKGVPAPFYSPCIISTILTCLSNIRSILRMSIIKSSACLSMAIVKVGLYISSRGSFFTQKAVFQRITNNQPQMIACSIMRYPVVIIDIYARD